MEVIETPVFTRQISTLLSDEEYRLFQFHLVSNPEAGKIVKGGGGVRKVRVGVGSRGRSGGARIIYYWAVRHHLILMLYAYPKNVVADLSPKMTAELSRAVKKEFGE